MKVMVLREIPASVSVIDAVVVSTDPLTRAAELHTRGLQSVSRGR